MKYGLFDSQLKVIEKALQSYSEIKEAVLFGSRAIGTFKEASDVDIALKGKKADHKLAINLKSYFKEETNLPYFFDFISYSSISNKNLRKHIDKYGVVIYRKGWRRVKLGDVVIFNYGKSLPKDKRVYGNIPVYSSAGIIGWHNKPLINNRGIIIGRKGTIGSVYISKKPFFPIDTVFYIIEKNDTYNLVFLFYILSKLNLNYLNSDSAVPGLNRYTAYEQKFYLPPLKEQKAIAEVLSSFDDKIELLYKQNKTLEDMAHTLFYKWFIKDAKPTWEEKPLNDVLSVRGGTTPSTKNSEYWNGEILWTTPKDLSKNKYIYLFNTNKKITKLGLKQISSGLLPAGTLLLSSRAPIGYLAFSVYPIAINQGYIAIIDNKKLPKEIIYLWLKAKMRYVKSHAGGSTFLEINKSSFKKLIIKLPSRSYINMFYDFIEPYFEKIFFNSKSILKLENTRNTLLPKLITGHLRVKL